MLMPILKKYIIYAKKINPELTVEARSKIRDFYLKIRQQKNNQKKNIVANK